MCGRGELGVTAGEFGGSYLVRGGEGKYNSFLTSLYLSFASWNCNARIIALRPLMIANYIHESEVNSSLESPLIE